jgi:hypothetical protein
MALHGLRNLWTEQGISLKAQDQNKKLENNGSGTGNKKRNNLILHKTRWCNTHKCAFLNWHDIIAHGVMLKGQKGFKPTTNYNN